MMRVVKADSVNDRGERQVMAEHLGLLGQFGFNVAASLPNTLFVKPECTVDRVAGTVTLDIPSLTPALTIAAPKGATHFQFNLGAGVIDFDTAGGGNESAIALAESETSVLTAETFAGTALIADIPAGTALPLFVLFGISFYHEVNGNP